ncbi:MAG: bifunctional 5,10-methylenetetrahydrofolate dehydrogenase/5,10-methenyltetrahydrofolate cyclohydrolase [bacterium]|nr:bifunctional 5,10-methylenetetrahydrofolate dehydrogenase/5,10-methenyltetrahydrofolate cyclohydrolase [bacterium]
MIIFNGKKLAERILLDLKIEISEKKITPALSVISVGEDAASMLFIKNKKEAAKRIGIRVFHYKFNETVKELEILQKIEELNGDPKVHGIIVQLPLPKNFNTGKIIEKIDPKKDVDGFHKINRDLLKDKKKPYFYPPFPLAIFTAIKSAKKNLKGKKVSAIVGSEIFGETLKNYLDKEKIKAQYVLKQKNYFLDIKTKLKSADILITVCGCKRQLKGDMIKEGAILIDGGITCLSNGKIVGNVDRKSVEKKAAFLTPVPGGIGPLTVAFLLKNTYKSAEKLWK